METAKKKKKKKNPLGGIIKTCFIYVKCLPGMLVLWTWAT